MITVECQSDNLIRTVKHKLRPINTNVVCNSPAATVSAFSQHEQITEAFTNAQINKRSLESVGQN